MARMNHVVPSQLPASVPGAVIDAEFSEVAPRHLREYLRLVYRYRWVAATCLGLTLGVTALLTVLTERTYTATTRLQVARQAPIQLQLQQNVLRVDDSDRNFNGTSSFMVAQVAMLRSRDLAERVIRGQHLGRDDAFLDPGPERRGLLGVGGRLLTAFRPRGWDAGTGAGSGFVRSDSGEVDPRLVDRYMRYLSVGEVRGADLVDVSFTTPSPRLSAFLAAAHTQAYIESNEEVQRANDVTAKDFLGRELLAARTRLETTQAVLSRFAAEHPNVAINEEHKTVAQRIADVSALLTKAEGTRVGLETRYAFLTRPGADTLAYFLGQPGVQKLHLALLDVRAQRAALAERLGSAHGQMLELARSEGELAAQLRAEVARETAGVRGRYDAAVLREEALSQKLTRLEQTTVELNGLSARYALLKNDVDTAHAMHDSLLKQQVETGVSSELAASTVRVLERAGVPEQATRPNVVFNLILGTILGLVFAGGAVFLCDHFDSSVKSSEEIEGVLHLPTLACVPNFVLARRSAGRPGSRRAPAAGVPGVGGFGTDLVVVHEPRSPAAEAFRALRTAILFSTPEAAPKVIALTSAGPGEGKTVSSVNLAACLAESGARVLLLDLDLRRPACHRTLGLANERGLSSFLSGQAEFDAVVQVLDAPRLSFVAAGPPPPNPAEMVGSTRMRETLERLRGEYDFVILDSPPVLPVTDAVVLGREADGVVLVVRGHETPRELVRRARDQLLQANVHILGAVVNNVDLRWGDHYFYGRYYGYGPSEPAALEEA